MHLRYLIIGESLHLKPKMKMYRIYLDWYCKRYIWFIFISIRRNCLIFMLIKCPFSIWVRQPMWPRVILKKVQSWQFKNIKIKSYLYRNFLQGIINDHVLNIIFSHWRRSVGHFHLGRGYNIFKIWCPQPKNFLGRGQFTQPRLKNFLFCD